MQGKTTKDILVSDNLLIPKNKVVTIVNTRGSVYDIKYNDIIANSVSYSSINKID